ncbi:hypothetical protein GGR52DRAFT_272797 [Hypoxylon sp. FL1284]|nr:hypothetical protein GGR52DRAFT_272797 [Hypoxylon sp. FL1284]
MKSQYIILALTALGQSVTAVAVPDAAGDVALDTRSQPESQYSDRSTSASEELWKRKGGGGGGGRGGSGGSSGGSSGGRGSPSSNGGGSTTTGSGPRPNFGGGSFYGGGARQPYRAGSPSPSGILPFVVGGAALGSVAFLGTHFAYGAYVYPYTHPYPYYNSTTEKNETKPVTCLCDQYETCGCDDNGNQTYFKEVIGDGSYQNLNKSLVTVADNTTNNESTIYILGTLPNGTTSSGGTEDPEGAAGSMYALARAAGWLPFVTTAVAIVCLS